MSLMIRGAGVISSLGGLGLMLWSDWVFTLGVVIFVIGQAVWRIAIENDWKPRTIAELTRGICSRRQLSIESAWSLVEVAKQEYPTSSPAELWRVISTSN